ncbi:hypothetical protein BKA56DRAFT_574097 [Ilyonectria sp. MPI-CAGE-AT-0026]|nr:hypothetical protein BKA56DRAFT_574097 [Ilyonectria sp. MPI-CAGE-AT-0026]
MSGCKWKFRDRLSSQSIKDVILPVIISSCPFIMVVKLMNEGRKGVIKWRTKFTKTPIFTYHETRSGADLMAMLLDESTLLKRVRAPCSETQYHASTMCLALFLILTSGYHLRVRRRDCWVLRNKCIMYQLLVRRLASSASRS